MANTSFLDLVKPAGTDKALVSVINSNSDKIDSGVSTLSEHFTSKTNKMFQYIDEKYVSANGTFTFSMESESHLAFVFVNFGNNTQAFYIIGTRNNYAELTIQPVVQSSYLSLTNNQYTITGICTYAARVFIYRT